MSKSLIIWIGSTNGFETLKFDDIKDFNESEEAIYFTYHGHSTKEQRHAAFIKQKLMGWAVSTENQNNDAA